MSGQSGFKSIRKLTSRAWSYILETSTQHPSLVAYARYSLPVKYKYERPDFLQLDDEGIVASADHEIRPIVAPKTTLLMNAGYAEVINAGKSLKTNEDQSCFHSFVVSVPIHQRKEEWKSADCHIPCVYFAIFDGHAGELHFINTISLIDLMNFLVQDIRTQLWISFTGKSGFGNVRVALLTRIARACIFC